MFVSKFVKWFLVSAMIVTLTACGGSSSADPTAQEIAIEEIATYAENGGTAPTVEDYLTAGVEGVNAENIDQINEVVEGLAYDDVDTQEEIQAIIDDLGITLPDVTPPVITLVGDAVVNIEVGTAYTDAGATASDNIDGSITGNIVTVNPVDTNTVGNYTVTYNVSDAAGNAATEVTRTVNVTADATAPVITLTGADPQNIEVGTAYTELGATANDNIDGDITASIDINTSAVDTNTVGSYTVTYNVSDAAGNPATEVTRTVNVTADVTSPVITLLGDANLSIEVGTAYIDAGATANDNIDGDITANIVTVNPVDINTVGIYTVTYDVNDSAGNDAVQVSRTVNVVDTTVPVITLLGANPQTIEVGTAYSELNATANDNYDGNITANIATDASDVNTSAVGSYTVTYDVDDTAGNSAAQVSRTVNVVDTTAPVITLTGAADINLSLGDSYTEQGATCTDNYDATCAVVIGGDTVDTATPGNYVVTYDANDTAGNAATQVTRTVNVLLAQESKLLSAGDRHTVEIRNGYLYAYGFNNHGQLGLGDTTDRNSPVQNVAEGNGWVSVSTGGDSSEYNPHEDLDVSGFTVAINSDGELFAWGDNTYGQLGDGTTGDHTTPNQVGTDTDWVSVSAGDQHVVAIKSNGTLYAWGHNNHGQLGDGTTADKHIPTAITAAGDGWVSVSAGGGDDTSLYSHSSGHSVAIKADGTLYAWGLNDHGQLGRTGDTTIPLQVGGDTDWESVSAGDSHTMAIKTNGTLWAWGWNHFGQLGDDTNGIDRLVPTAVDTTGVTGTTWTSVSAGSWHTVATRNDGSLWTWGRNDYGALGYGTLFFTDNPVQEGTGAGNWVSANAGGFHTVATKSTGTWTWGDNTYGQLGNGMLTDKHEPIQESTDANWTSASTGGNHTVAIKVGGTLWSWGRNHVGQLGDGTAPLLKIDPVQVGIDSDWVNLTTGFEYSAAIKSGGTLWTWGDNYYGQLGDGTIDNQTTPNQVGGDIDWASVASGGWHTVAIKDDGAGNRTLWSWGRNHVGQLGNGTVDDSNHSTPEQIGADNNWSSASVSDSHSVAINTDGELFAWGDNTYGQLGDGSTENNSTPEQIGLDTWSSVSASDYHTVAINSLGQLWVWGHNNHGQLGLGDTADRNTPTQIVGHTWLSVSTGDYHTIAVRSDNTLWAWGWNDHGQMGDNTTAEKHVPTQIGFAADWVSVSGGDFFSVAINGDDKLFAWGYNEYGQVHTWVTLPTEQP